MTSHTPTNKGKGNNLKDLVIGGVVQIAEAMTLGMPFEVWKTMQLSTMRSGQVESSMTTFGKLCAGGPSAAFGRFYKGSSAKNVECALKGSLLFFTSEIVLDMCESLGYKRNAVWCQSFAGCLGGISQTIVMAPMTLIVTHKNNHPTSHDGMLKILREYGPRQAYSSAPAIALRQGSNWALRGLLAQWVTNVYRSARGMDPSERLSTPAEVMCGFAGGALACVNQPTEVLRVVVQSNQAAGKKMNTREAASYVYKTYGFKGFYAALIPRIGLSAWQTVFLVTVARRTKEYMNR